MNTNLETIIARIEALERAVFSSKNKPTKAVQSKPTTEYSGPQGGVVRLVEEGFFASPRSLGQVKQKLAEYEYHYRTQSIANALDRSSKLGGSLVTLKVGGKKNYIRRK